MGFASFQNRDNGSELPKGGNDVQPDRQVEEVSKGAHSVGAEVLQMGVRDPIRACHHLGTGTLAGLADHLCRELE